MQIGSAYSAERWMSDYLNVPYCTHDISFLLSLALFFNQWYLDFWCRTKFRILNASNFHILFSDCSLIKFCRSFVSDIIILLNYWRSSTCELHPIKLSHTVFAIFLCQVPLFPGQPLKETCPLYCITVSFWRNKSNWRKATYLILLYFYIKACWRNSVWTLLLK